VCIVLDHVLNIMYKYKPLPIAIAIVTFLGCDESQKCKVVGIEEVTVLDGNRIHGNATDRLSE
jgi:hypothetical protein